MNLEQRAVFLPLLKEAGWEVRITHLRRSNLEEGVGLATKKTIKQNGLTPHPRGGITAVTIAHEERGIIVQGLARCSERDNYSRKLGRNIALGRALKQLRLN